MQQETPHGDCQSRTESARLESVEDASEAKTVGSSLDHLIGTWTQVEEDEMIAVLKEFDMFTESRGQD